MRIPAYRPPRQERADKPVRGLLLGSLAALLAAAVPVVIAQADTAAGYVTATATFGSQANVAPGGTITGLADLDDITLDFQASGAGNQVTQVQLRQCRSGSDISSFDQFRPTVGGKCVAPSVGFHPPEGGFLELQADDPPALQHVTGAFEVGTGSAPSENEDGPLENIECDTTHPCELWARVTQPQSSLPSQEAYLHWNLQFGSGGGGGTTTTGGGGGTTTTAGGGGSTTSTTKASSTTSTTKASSSSSSSTSTTSTTLPAGTTLTPTTVAAGGTITVSSTGWQASQPVAITLTSDPVTLPAITADSAGRISGTITIPAATTAGAHTLTFTGKNTSGQTRTVTAGVTVTSTSGSSTSTTGAGGATTTTRSSGGGLPNTGWGALKSAWSALALVVAGGLFVEAARRRRRFDRAGW